MKKIILLFGFDDLPGTQQAFALGQLTSAMDVTVSRVGRESFHRTLISLLQAAAGGENNPDAKKEPVSSQPEPLPARMLLFAGFSDTELYQTLDLCTSCGIPRDDLKAALTPANSRWNARKLCENILEEHRQILQKS